ncbi:hypothetical protein AMAG_13341 [Allomyces macrogynus ATCC 38327]|uniref:Uncharacterized protein n=1 Tax=Allomyces macrogynus (strain ATCC 38327) TaxID=578462 RepID=A0A0L0T1T6_ALLM3|nr:hypothetical protein AMAG_13341 [Allomyces macrogynus ATCC 38327]|eukprot:KNE68697.1 hypothetical protein AMAG_13341 [Allomyces macrogynus ATCC 38327]
MATVLQYNVTILNASSGDGGDQHQVITSNNYPADGKLAEHGVVQQNITVANQASGSGNVQTQDWSQYVGPVPDGWTVQTNFIGQNASSGDGNVQSQVGVATSASGGAETQVNAITQNAASGKNTDQSQSVTTVSGTGTHADTNTIAQNTASGDSIHQTQTVTNVNGAQHSETTTIAQNTATGSNIGQSQVVSTTSTSHAAPAHGSDFAPISVGEVAVPDTSVDHSAPFSPLSLPSDTHIDHLDQSQWLGSGSATQTQTQAGGVQHQSEAVVGTANQGQDASIQSWHNGTIEASSSSSQNQAVVNGSAEQHQGHSDPTVALNQGQGQSASAGGDHSAVNQQQVQQQWDSHGNAQLQTESQRFQDGSAHQQTDQIQYTDFGANSQQQHAEQSWTVTGAGQGHEAVSTSQSQFQSSWEQHVGEGVAAHQVQEQASVLVGTSGCGDWISQIQSQFQDVSISGTGAANGHAATAGLPNVFTA